MKHIFLPLLAIVFSACAMDTSNNIEQAVIDESLDETIISELDSITEKVTDSLTYSFNLIDPDTSFIKQRIDELDYSKTEMYLYLSKNYEVISKDSVVYYEWEEISNQECAFIETYSPGIRYELSDCSEEGGIFEKVTFPRVENSSIKAFIQKLFETEDNTWTDEFSYEADGAGCYYNVTHTDSTSSIDIYCGC